MSKVRIVQMLCPARHCVVATAYESPDGNEIPEATKQLRASFDAWVKLGANPWCGICASRNLHTEDQPTIFATMTEAKPHLEENERQQAAARAFFKASRG